MFITEESTVDVIIYYKKIGFHFLSFGESEFKLSDLTDEDKSTFKKITIKMKQLTWGLYNDLQEGAIDIDHEGNRRFNYKKYKELRLIKLISSWDATAADVNGKEVPVKVSEKSIKCLAPQVAESIINTYDEIMYLSEAEEKK